MRISSNKNMHKLAMWVLLKISDCTLQKINNSIYNRRYNVHDEYINGGFGKVLVNSSDLYKLR